MKPVIEDFPVLSASLLRALGVIGRDTTSTIITFDGAEGEFVVEVTSKYFPHCGGDWSMFRCSCGRRCQKLRLFEGKPVCTACLREAGVRRYRIEMFSHASKRTAYTAAKRIARLTNPVPEGIKPRTQLWGVLDRRRGIEERLRRSLIVSRQHAIDEHDEMLARMLKDE